MPQSIGELEGQDCIGLDHLLQLHLVVVRGHLQHHHIDLILNFHLQLQLLLEFH